MHTTETMYDMEEKNFDNFLNRYSLFIQEHKNLKIQKIYSNYV